MKPQIFTLENGLQVIFIDTKAFPTLTTLLLVGAGSRYEDEKNNGIAHFFEHMAFKGSKKYPDTFIISSKIESLGGVFNAFTSKDHTGYWIKSTNEHFETVIDVLSDMIINPLLKKEEIEREKGVIVEEINLYEDTPYRKVSDLFDNLLYNDSPLGFDIAGTKKTVVNFNQKTFIDYIHELYHPKNAVLVIAGGLSQVQSQKSKVENNLDFIEEKFKDWKNGQKRKDFVKAADHQNKPAILLRYKKTEQAHFCLGFRAFSFFDKRKYALNLLATILGGGMSSRLFIEVRERRGLCYYISTGRELYHDVGYLVTQAGVTNNLNKIKEAIEVILDQHKKIISGRIKNEELNKAKELLKGRLLLSLEDSFNVASFYGTKKILEDKLESPRQAIDNLMKINLEDIVNLASEIFVPNRLNLALLGPFKKKEELEEILKI